jgi:uncharacterized membrane protein
MNQDRKNAVFTGVLFIVDDITSIIGLALYTHLLNDPDFLLKGSGYGNQVILGAFFELVAACLMVGTAIMLFPYLRRHSESIAIGYVCFRLFEAVLVVIGTLSLLSLVTLSQKVASGMVLDMPYLKASDTLFRSVHSWTFILGPNYMLGINTMLYSYSLYKTKLIPRPLATLGLTGAAFIFITALLEMFGVFPQLSVWGAILAIPVFAYEMSLAVWLIVKGFNLYVIATDN